MTKRDASYAGSRQAYMDQYDYIITRLKNMCLSAAGLVIGSGSKKKVKIANTVTYLSDRIFKSKTTAEVDFTATTHDIAANASSVQEAMYLITLSANGTPTVTMGTVSTGAGTAKLPEIPSTGTPIGAVRVAVAAGSTIFDATSDDLDAVHLTVTYYDYGFLAAEFNTEL